jgi:Uma2 family endonuclease
MSALPSGEPLLSRDVFRQMESAAASDVRLERMDGYVYAMAGAGLAHERVVANLMFELRSAARDDGCEVLGSNRRLTIGEGSDFLPDVSVYCDPTDNDEYAGTRPCLVIEVLSRSTAIDDLNLKLPRYKTIPSLEAILFVNTAPLYASLYLRGSQGWEQHDYIDADDELDLPCPPMRLRLNQLGS